MYSDDAILCALMIKVVYHLPLRALEGFLVSLLELLGILLPVPSYTQICRRAASLGQTVKRLSSKKNITDIVIDSSGLKVHGEGEWKVRQHGKSKRRTWRKIHLGICSNSQEIVLSLLTENAVSDGEAVEEMAKEMPPTVRRGCGDGAYDKSNCYKKFQELGIDWITPPQKGAVLHDLKHEPWMEQRNDAIRIIAGLGNDEEARCIWKKLKKYHRRSLAETGVYSLHSKVRVLTTSSATEFETRLHRTTYSSCAASAPAKPGSNSGRLLVKLSNFQVSGVYIDLKRSLGAA